MTGIERRTSGGISYLERGSAGGPVLVLLHGIGSNARSFTPVMKRLAASWRVIAWNAPGYGGSAPLDADWPVARDYARALEAFVERLGLERMFLAGHSLGTLIAARFAVDNGGCLNGLLLASCATGHGVPQGGPLSAAAQRRLDDLDLMGAERFAAQRAARLVFEPERNPLMVEQVRTAMAAISRPGYAAAVRMLASGRLAEDAARLAVPTGVIVGAEDLVTPSEASRAIHLAIPAPWRGAFDVVPGAGHALHQQAPDAFVAALETLSAEPARTCQRS